MAVSSGPVLGTNALEFTLIVSQIDTIGKGPARVRCACIVGVLGRSVAPLTRDKLFGAGEKIKWSNSSDIK